MIDLRLKDWATPRQAEYIDAVNEYGSFRKAAKMLGSKQAPIGVTRAVWRRINRVERYDISARAIAVAESQFAKAA